IAQSIQSLRRKRTTYLSSGRRAASQRIPRNQDRGPRLLQQLFGRALTINEKTSPRGRSMREPCPVPATQEGLRPRPRRSTPPSFHPPSPPPSGAIGEIPDPADRTPRLSLFSVR